MARASLLTAINEFRVEETRKLVQNFFKRRQEKMKLNKVSLVIACGAMALMMSAAQAGPKAKIAKLKTNPLEAAPPKVKSAVDTNALVKVYNEQDGSAYRNLAQQGEPTFSADYLELKKDLEE